MTSAYRAFVAVACSPRDRGHASGALDQAEAILAAHPHIATSDIYAAAIVGDAAALRRFLAGDRGLATKKGGPYEWDALTYLCFSRYLRLDRARAAAFLSAAEALLDAGASASTGWLDETHQPRPVWESAIYGAAGVARHADLTRLLLERGADPNDEETPYHVPETRDNETLAVLVTSGKLTADSLATMLLRKSDWHDEEGVALLLAAGADPNRVTRWGKTALVQAVLRDNELAIIERLLDHGANPATAWHGRTLVELAARRGRGDVLAILEQHGAGMLLDGPARLIAACARNDEARVRDIAGAEPELVSAVRADGAALLSAFAGVGNAAGLRCLLDLGLDAGERVEEGDGYWDIARDSTALHVAAWRARHDVVALLIERGAPVDAVDAVGRTPLMLAVRACVDSYWSDRRSPESVRALLHAGASTRGIQVPSGYDEVDGLLRR